MSNETSRVMFYNIWAHRYPELLQQYLKQEMANMDIFCFTEVTSDSNRYGPAPSVYMGDPKREPPARLDGINRLNGLLKNDYLYIYHSPKNREWTCLKTDKVYSDVCIGSALFYHINLKVIATGKVLLDSKKSTLPPRVMQWIVYEKNEERYVLAHLHGVWIPNNTKGDVPVQQQQSLKIREILQRLSERYRSDKVVFGGDLNLAIHTKALRTLVEGDGTGIKYRNLIVEEGIQSTRTKNYRKFDETNAPQHADYILVSPAVKVLSFTVRTDILASDHAPLRIEFA